MQSLGIFISPFVSFKVTTACTLSKLIAEHHSKKALHDHLRKDF